MTNMVQLTQGTLMFFSGIALMGLGLIAGMIFLTGRGRRKRKLEQKMQDKY